MGRWAWFTEEVGVSGRERAGSMLSWLQMQQWHGMAWETSRESEQMVWWRVLYLFAWPSEARRGEDTA